MSVPSLSSLLDQYLPGSTLSKHTGQRSTIFWTSGSANNCIQKCYTGKCRLLNSSINKPGIVSATMTIATTATW